MTSTKNSPTQGKTEEPGRSATRSRRKRVPAPTYSAHEKVQAVLAVWTEKTKPAEVCRQLGINWVSFNQWQERAMEGMLQALEGRVNLSSGQALSPRLQALLHKRQTAPESLCRRLSSRLEQLQQSEPKSTTTPTPAARASRSITGRETPPPREPAN